MLISWFFLVNIVPQYLRCETIRCDKKFGENIVVFFLFVQFDLFLNGLMD